MTLGQMMSHKNLRENLCALNLSLLAEGLVKGTSGNVSECLPDRTGFYIKPSGVPYSQLSPDQMVLCDLDGNVIDGKLSPSSDTATHAYIYRNMPKISGVTHTHSQYASAWSAVRKAIPCVLTTMADEFGGGIPVGPFALIGNDQIGRGVVETLRDSRSNAVLMANHGVFTIGVNAAASVKSAVMCEDAAKTIWIASQLGSLVPISETDIDYLYHRYHNIYGQREI
jgi:L-ribulose-5-phosphate 4-epimerase